jgi:hypothetical protein
MDAVGEGFMMTCSEDEANKLVKDCTVIASLVIVMLTVHMS